MTALVIFLSGAWSRSPDQPFLSPPQLTQSAAGEWILEGGRPRNRPDRPWQPGDSLLVHLSDNQAKIAVTGRIQGESSALDIRWDAFPWDSAQSPTLDPGLYVGYTGASFTALAFDRVHGGLSAWPGSDAIGSFSAW